MKDAEKQVFKHSCSQYTVAWYVFVAMMAFTGSFISQVTKYVHILLREAGLKKPHTSLIGKM